MRCLRLLVVISVVTPPLACIEYKAEPEDGKQACASTGTKLCPDNYQCIEKKCWKKGSGPSGAGGTAGGGSSGARTSSTSGGTMDCTDAGLTCEKLGGTLTICCDDSQCKYLAGSREFPCAGFDCQTASQDAVNECTGWSTGGAGGSMGGASGQAGAKSGSSSRTGGSTTVSSSDTVTFRNGAAVGPVTGYGWIALAADDTVNDPTCDSARLPITSTQPCTAVTNWNASNALCVSGKMPPLPENATTTDYNNNWGIQIGVNATESATGILGRSYSTMSVAVTNAPAEGFRIVLHRQGDIDSVNYCLDVASSGTVVQLRKFNTLCWGEKDTVYLQPSDIPNISRLGVQFNSAKRAITLTNTCITSITFGY